MSGDEAIRELLELDYEFFVDASRCGRLHPCVVEQLHADYAIAKNYADLIGCVRGSTLDDAHRVIAGLEPCFRGNEAFIHAKATVLTILSIHGKRPGPISS